MSVSKSKFLERIKQETLSAHQNIEKSYLTRSIVAENISEVEYVDLLKRFLRFYRPCEAKIREINFLKKEELSLESRYKVPLIEQDLQYLGISSAEIQLLTHYPNLPHLVEDTHILGYLYVIEGATLGGQFLSRSLSRHFGFTATQGAMFFNSYGKEKIGQMWKSFRGILESYVMQFPEQTDGIIESANETFKQLDLCLNEQG